VLQSGHGFASVTNRVHDPASSYSVWSDRVETIAQMAEGAMARGWNRIAVTDHSNGLAIAGGMSTEAMRDQHEEIDASTRPSRDDFVC